MSPEARERRLDYMRRRNRQRYQTEPEFRAATIKRAAEWRTKQRVDPWAIALRGQRYDKEGR